uniref:Uncharacterized protein n=1 Tax=Anguilla anguilla TaxID=7936 RepID=A0A0E9U6C8_ANGAN
MLEIQVFVFFLVHTNVRSLLPEQAKNDSGNR